MSLRKKVGYNFPSIFVENIIKIEENRIELCNYAVMGHNKHRLPKGARVTSNPKVREIQMLPSPILIYDKLHL
jgi:hypothetical protein